MRKRLREVAQESLGCRLVLLREKANIVPQGEKPLENSTSLAWSALQDEVVREPEAAGQKHALSRRQPVQALVRAVAHHEAVDRQLALDRFHGPFDARIAAWQEADDRDQEQARVELARAVVLDERVTARVIAVPAHVGVDALP